MASSTTVKHLGGEGPAALLIHGFGADRQSWLGVAPALFHHASIWAIDLPGHGESWQRQPATSLKTMADQLLPILANISEDPVHLVGHSLGGALSLLSAASEPTKVASLSLIAPAGLGNGVDAGFLNQFPMLNDADSILRLLRSTVHNPKLIGAQIAPVVLAQLERDGVRGAMLTTALALQGNNSDIQQATNLIVSADIPRQVIWGAQDTINPVNFASQAVFGGNWHLLEQCGHLPHIEHRTTVTQHLATFLEYNTQPDTRRA